MKQKIRAFAGMTVAGQIDNFLVISINILCHSEPEAIVENIIGERRARGG